MKAFQKWLLILAMTGLVIGIPVSASHVQLAPAWTVALPAGVVFLGLFLISLLLQKEVARFDAEQRSKIGSARRNPPFPSAEENKQGVNRADELLQAPEVTEAHSR